MGFEEKIDAMRVTLELAMHDIEAQRGRIEELRERIEELRVATETQRGSIDELRDASASQYETAQVWLKATENLVTAAAAHERRIVGMEGRI